MEIPTLKTEKLVLRPFRIEDAPLVQKYAGDHKIAEMTGTIPHPYSLEMAKEWIPLHKQNWETKRSLTLAMVPVNTSEIVGCVSLIFSMNHRRAELGYWVGVPHWGNGYCTDASRAIVQYGFDNLEIDKITSAHMTKNPASGKVLQKIGMQKEGLLRKQMVRLGQAEDLVVFGLFRDEFIG